MQRSESRSISEMSHRDVSGFSPHEPKSGPIGSNDEIDAADASFDSIFGCHVRRDKSIVFDSFRLRR